jgi:hypothetical protein
MATMDEVWATCERCGTTTAVVIVDSDEERLTPEQQAAVDAYSKWFERFDPEQDAYVGRCPRCVDPAEEHLWIRNDADEYADHTARAPGYRRKWRDASKDPLAELHRRPSEKCRPKRR